MHGFEDDRFSFPLFCVSMVIYGIAFEIIDTYMCQMVTMLIVIESLKVEYYEWVLPLESAIVSFQLPPLNRELVVFYIYTFCDLLSDIHRFHVMKSLVVFILNIVLICFLQKSFNSQLKTTCSMTREPMTKVLLTEILYMNKLIPVTSKISPLAEPIPSTESFLWSTWVIMWYLTGYLKVPATLYLGSWRVLFTAELLRGFLPCLAHVLCIFCIHGPLLGCGGVMN